MSRPLPDLQALVLVGCSADKLDHAAPAADLYSPSRLFRAARALARRAAGGWAILSAEHGLVRPDQVLAPYDLRLDQLDRAARRAWGERVAAELAGESCRRVVVLAGATYARELRAALGPEWTVEEPLAGLGVGSRYAQLVAWDGELGAPAAYHTASGRAMDPNGLARLGWLGGGAPGAPCATGCRDLRHAHDECRG